MEQRKFVLSFSGITAALFAVFVAVLFLSGTGADPAAGGANPGGVRADAGATSTAPAQTPDSPPTLTVRESDYGQIVFDRDGRALYAFTSDPRGESVCADACAAAWPPYLVDGTVRAGERAEQSLLATIRRPDGGRQVTYAGRPLYYYIGDREPGQVLCQNVVEFGGTWLVVAPDGRLVR